MRITEEETEYEDIMWFAVDNIGNIAMFTSGVYGNVPEFICKSRENVESLIKFFCDELKCTTQAIALKDKSFGTELISDCKVLSQKGLFCYDSFDGNNHINSYLKITEPVKPLVISSLPKHIQNIIIGNKMDNIIFGQESIHVEHAYK